jgi:hypothetical protein
MPCRSDRARLAAIGVVIVALATLPGQALGAKLIGGRRQAAVTKSFSALHAHKGELIVSIRASTVSPSWVVVESVRPEHSARTSPQQTSIRLRSTYFHRAGTVERPGNPPRAVRNDLDHVFRVAIVYTGSGSENLRYEQTYGSACAGAGGFVDQQDATVSPMSWSVRYIVDLDSLQAALTSAPGSTIVPTVAFDSSGSVLTATEKLSRSYVDQGCFNRPTTYKCVAVYHLSSPGAAGLLSFDPGLGTEIGIPMKSTTSGQCAQDYFTVGPSLWDSGASTVAVPKLGLLGGSLPSNPYAPVRVSWPGSSALEQQGFLASPCQGIPAACSDRLRWRGVVQLEPVSGG